jgi:hypothetical protein
MDERWREHEEEEKHVPLFVGRTRMGRDRLVDLDLEAMIILQWILQT